MQRQKEWGKWIKFEECLEVDLVEFSNWVNVEVRNKGVGEIIFGFLFWVICDFYCIGRVVYCNLKFILLLVLGWEVGEGDFLFLNFIIIVLGN